MSEEAKSERASLACRHAEGVKSQHAPFRKNRARQATRRRGPRWRQNAGPRITPPFPLPCAATVVTSTTEVEEGSAPQRCPGNEYASRVLFEVLSSSSALLGPGYDGQRFALLHGIIHPELWRSGFGPDMAKFWKGPLDELDVFPPECSL